MHAVGYVHQDIGLHSIIYIDGVGYLSEIDTNIAFLGTPRRACSDPVWIVRLNSCRCFNPSKPVINIRNGKRHEMQMKKISLL